VTESKEALYARRARELAELLDGESDFLANAANFVALLFHSLPDLNWAGLYLHRHDELVLGPFQGKPACVRIAVGRGVCGTAAERRRTVVVPDVSAFPGHLVCDPASRSEVVVPLLVDGDLVGVVDLDSPVRGRFDAEDEAGLETLVGVFLAKTSMQGRPA
jgi:GAF domain-containing protein